VSDPFRPSVALLVKLGSAIVHAGEMTEPGSHEFDLASFMALATDPEVVAWREQMDELALLPKKRSAESERLRVRRWWGEDT
jgi:hypothetical protein